MTNGQIMKIMEEIAVEWAREKSDEQCEAVVDYLNMLCYKWMGGDWGLRVKHIKPPMDYSI